MILRQRADETSEKMLIERALKEPGVDNEGLVLRQALIVDAGFSLAYLLKLCSQRFQHVQHGERLVRFVCVSWRGWTRTLPRGARNCLSTRDVAADRSTANACGPWPARTRVILCLPHRPISAHTR